ARAHALAGYARAKHDPVVLARLAALFAQYHQPPDTTIVNLTEAGRDRFAQLLKSPNWASLVAGDDALAASNPFDIAGWDRAAGAVQKELSEIYLAQVVHTSELAGQEGRLAV